jgi:hypothetical protein
MTAVSFLIFERAELMIQVIDPLENTLYLRCEFK